MNDILVLFYLYSRRSKSKIHASCLFINITVNRLPWQQTCEILREKGVFTIDFSQYLA